MQEKLRQEEEAAYQQKYVDVLDDETDCLSFPSFDPFTPSSPPPPPQIHNIMYMHTLTHTHNVHRLAAQEQERRDYELALRLAQDEMRPQQAVAENVSKAPGAAVQSQIAHSSLQRSTAAHRLTQEQEAARKKYNLTKWKFAELRDTINTSCGKPSSLSCVYACESTLSLSRSLSLSLPPSLASSLRRH